MDNWDRTRLIGLHAKAKLDATMADPEARKNVEAAVIRGNALFSMLSRREKPHFVEPHSKK